MSVKRIHQFLYLIYGYIFFRRLEKFIEEERDENKERNSRGVITRWLLQDDGRKVKDRNDEILGIDLLFVA